MNGGLNCRNLPKVMEILSDHCLPACGVPDDKIINSQIVFLFELLGPERLKVRSDDYRKLVQHAEKERRTLDL